MSVESRRQSHLGAGGIAATADHALVDVARSIVIGDVVEPLAIGGPDRALMQRLPVGDLPHRAAIDWQQHDGARRDVAESESGTARLTVAGDAGDQSSARLPPTGAHVEWPRPREARLRAVEWLDQERIAPDERDLLSGGRPVGGAHAEPTRRCDA